MQQVIRPLLIRHEFWKVGFRRFRLPLELVFVAVLGVMALTVNIGQPPLVDWDEATYAQVAHEALGQRPSFGFDLEWRSIRQEAAAIVLDGDGVISRFRREAKCRPGCRRSSPESGR